MHNPRNGLHWPTATLQRALHCHINNMSQLDGQDQEESQLRIRLAGALSELSSILNDLGTHLLSKGKVAEAQELLDQLATLRQPQLAAAAQELQARLGGVTLPAPQEGGQVTGSSGIAPVETSNTATSAGTLDAGPDLATATAQDEDEDSWEKHEPVLPKAATRAPLTPPPEKKATTSTGSSNPWSSSKAAPSSKAKPQKFKSAFDEEVSAEAAEEGANTVVWEGGFTHCVEVFGLTQADKTSHLQELLDELLPGVSLQPRIQWADDNHAVFVCPDTTTAELLLESAGELGFSVRPFTEATQASKQLPISELLPPKPRPKTTTAVARKLLSHALGIPSLRDKEAEKQLAAARKVAKQERAAKRDSADTAWGDDA